MYALCAARPAPPVPRYQPTLGHFGPTVDRLWFEVLPSGRPQSRPGAPEATFFLVFFLDAHFRPFWEPFSAFGTHFGDLGLSETYVFLR